MHFMAENKTKQTEASVAKFLNTIPDEAKRKDCFEIAAMMQDVSKCDAKMWGPSIVGFGVRHYKYESGREGDICMIGFSPRKNNITLYVLNYNAPQSGILNKLGKHKTGKGCLYINKLGDVDSTILKKLIKICFDSKK